MSLFLLGFVAENVIKTFLSSILQIWTTNRDVLHGVLCNKKALFLMLRHFIILGIELIVLLDQFCIYLLLI